MAAVIMPLQAALEYVNRAMSHREIGEVIGVTPDQVYKYKAGRTSTCRESVVDAIYDNFTNKGRQILINYYEDEEEYLELRRMRDDKAK